MVRRSPLQPAVIFDLDGTLVDSARGIAAALNATAASGCEISVAMVRSLVSLGAEALVKGALNVPDHEIADTLTAFRKMYSKAPCEPEDIYPGAQEALVWLKEMKIGVAVCTNKPQGLAELVLTRLGLAPLVDVVVGGAAGLHPKPSPAPIQLTLALLNGAVRPIFVGDSEVDARACSSAKVPFVHASFGYEKLSEGLDCVGTLSDFFELPGLVKWYFSLR